MGAGESKTCTERALVYLWKASKNERMDQLLNIVGHPDVLSIIDRVHPTQGTTPLMVAAKYGRVKAVELLLESGARPNLQDLGKIKDHCGSALHYAASKNQADVIRLLLASVQAKNVNPHLCNALGHSPLDIARMKKCAEAEAMLRQYSTVLCGWLGTDIRKKKSGSKRVGSWFWKKRWCVLLRCTLDNRRYEIAVYKAPGDVCPQYVGMYNPQRDLILQLKEDRQSTLMNLVQKLPLLKKAGKGQKTQTWMDSPIFQFAFESSNNGILWQVPLSGTYYSRVGERRQKSADPVTESGSMMVFSAWTEQEMETWICTLQDPNCDPENGRNQNQLPRDDRYWIPEEEEEDQAGDCPPLFSSFDSSTTYHSFRSRSSQISDSSSCASFIYASAPALQDLDEELEFYSDSRSSQSSILELFAIDDVECDTENRTEKHQPRNIRMDNEEKEIRTMEVPNDDCVICMDVNRDAVAVPCGHLVSCYSCLESYRDQDSGCPICRGEIEMIIRVYNS